MIIENLLAERGKAKEVKEFTQGRRRPTPRTAPTTPSAWRSRSRRTRASWPSRSRATPSTGRAAPNKVGKYYCLAVSETTTYEGRMAMVYLKELLPKHFPDIHIVYGDTDSIMYTRKEAIPDMEACGKRGHEVAELVTADYAARGYPSMELEFEKAFEPYNLLKKKRYAGRKFEPGPDGTMVCKGIDAKGIETERKDTLPLTKDTLLEAMDRLLMHKDKAGAYKCIEARLMQLVRNEVPFDDLVLSKSLSASYANPDSIVQARVNQKRREREPGSEESVGGRVQYVILNGHKKDKTTDLAECADHARKHNLPLNRLWYLEHMIEKPLKSFFERVPGVDIDYLLERTRLGLDHARLGMAGGLMQGLIKTGGGSGASSSADGKADGGGGSSSDVVVLNPVKVRVPRPPPPPVRKKKAKA